MHPTGNTTNSSYSPSFNSYFNTDLADIAARVTTEFPDSDDFAVTDDDMSNNVAADAQIGCDNEFEFDLSNLMPEDGEIRPVYPVFNRDLLRDLSLVGEIESRPSVSEEADSSKAQIQLKNLFLEDRDLSFGDLGPPSSSSSDADEMEEIPPETYCVWEPNKSPVASPSPGRCTKSNSTGSTVSVATAKAKTWKLKEFLKRSKSDGKEGLVVLTPKKKVEDAAVACSSVSGDVGKPRRVAPAKKTTARDGYYGGVRSRQGVENRRKSYLPYRQDLVGLFATPQAFRKMHLPPF